ncbi:MAG: hypothetical protein U5K69_17095 [Balneolaceae bacterium]|nr:hypothetical protein [Balneolaceae bacterium]
MSPDLIGRYNDPDVDYWTPDNPTNDQPRPNVESEGPLYGSSRGYQDGSFLKIRNIRLGYNLPLNPDPATGHAGLSGFMLMQKHHCFISKTGNIDPEDYFGTMV